MSARNTISISNTISMSLCLAFGVTLLAPRGASAQTLTINFDENGKGTITGGGTTIPLTSLGLTPDPTSGMTTLTYDLRGNPLVDGRNIRQGDVVLFEDPATGVPSDLLRWLDTGILYVYSNRPEPGETPDLADVGMPPNQLGNPLVLPETGPENGVNGLFGYVPAQNQPGFIGGSGPNSTTYNFTSDTPEPGSLAVAAIGGAWMLRRRRRQHR